MDKVHGLIDDIKELFSIKNYNLIEDENYYYLFRALNNGDHNDIQNKTTTNRQGVLTHIRTDRARYIENTKNKNALYSENDYISLMQVVDHIKRGHRTDTNCISLSSNANVAVMYGNGCYHDEYVLIKIPKNKASERVYNVSEYMLLEIEKRIQNAVKTANEEVNKLVESIDLAKSNEELINIITNSYCLSLDNKKVTSYFGVAGQTKRKIPVRSRFNEYASLSDEQNLLKNKVIAKLTLLEEKNVMNPIILHNRFDTTVLRALGMAISSSEVVHYGQIGATDKKDEVQIFQVEKSIMHSLGLLQQVVEKRPDLAYRAKKMEGMVVQHAISGASATAQVEQHYKEKPTIASIKQAYELCGGKLQYEDAIRTLEKIFYLSKSVINARQYSILINELTGNNEKNKGVIDAISSMGIDVEPQLMNKRGKSSYKVSESVRIPIMKYEEGLIQEIQSKQTQVLQEYVEDVSNGKTLVSSLNKIQDSPAIPINEYYARAIFKSYNWEEQHICFSLAHEERFIKKLKEHKISVMYETLMDIGVEESILPTIIINLIISDNDETNKILNSIEHENVPMELINQINNLLGELSRAISVSKIEDYLDFFKVVGTDIKLRDYQQSAINNIKKIFSTHKFASVILPTGTGKSFVAIAELIIMQKIIEIAKINNKIKSNGKILYLAPSEEILDQIKKYTELYVHGEKLNKTRSQIFKDIFPNVHLATYQSLLSKSYEELRSMKYSFIVLDELHRAGAQKWGEKLKILLEAQDENTKVLGLTATPQRDADNRNMADEMAVLLGYTDQEVKSRKHIAKNMSLVDAIRLGIVVAPQIVECDYNLKNDDESWKSLLKTIEGMEDGLEKQKYEHRYMQLRSRVENAKGIPELFKSSITKKDGRYIFYMPIGINDYVEDENGKTIGTKSGAEKVEQAQKYLIEWLKYVDDKPEFYSMLGEYSDAKNRKELDKFENSASNHIKVMVVMNKLNEGVHIRGIDGIIWQRSLDEDSSILLLQQLGRVIKSPKEGEHLRKEDIPIVIDLPNNLSRVNLNKAINTYSDEEDIAILQTILDWIFENNKIFPDINSQFKEEARLAGELKRIQGKYILYKKDEEFSKLEGTLAENTALILNMGSEIDLWDINLPEKELKVQNGKTQENTVNLEEFIVEGLAKDFCDLVDNVAKTKMVQPVMEWIRDNGRIPNYLNDKLVYQRWIISREKKIADAFYKEAGDKKEFTSEELSIVKELSAYGYFGKAKTLTIMEWIRQNKKIPSFDKNHNEYQRWYMSKEKKLVDYFLSVGEDEKKFSAEELNLIRELKEYGYSGRNEVVPIMKWIRANGKIPVKKQNPNEYQRWYMSKEKKLADNYCSCGGRYSKEQEAIMRRIYLKNKKVYDEQEAIKLVKKLVTELEKYGYKYKGKCIETKDIESDDIHRYQ